MKKSPLLIALPHGLTVGGVTTWAMNMAAELPRLGRPVALAAHAPKPGEALAKAPAGATVLDFSALPRLEWCQGDLSAFIGPYRDAVRTLAKEHAAPVLLAPCQLGDCFGIAAALCVAEPELIRVVGWQHSPIEYDSRVLGHYEPVMARFVAVSTAMEAALRARLPMRAGDISHIPHGVAAPDTIPARPAASGRPLRLVYTGRIENDLKRVAALVRMSDELSARGVDHKLTLLGGGPAEAEIDRLSAERPRVRRLAEVPPEHVARVLDENDVFVLASRVEGLSMSLLEAMARGCAPVVTRTPSGSEQLVEDGRSGVLVDVPAHADERETGKAMAVGVERAIKTGVPAIGAAAWARAREKFSPALAAKRVDAMLDQTAKSPARAWPSTRACAFTSAGPGGSGSVPSEGAERLRDVLTLLAGRSVLIHGAGRHTIELASVLAESAARIVAVADDDPGKHGQSLWGWPIVAPAEAARTGATDVVISSWMNQEQIWARRGVYEAQRLRVHRIYKDKPTR